MQTAEQEKVPHRKGSVCSDTQRRNKGVIYTKKTMKCSVMLRSERKKRCMENLVREDLVFFVKSENVDFLTDGYGPMRI